jgi:hypothetical protein
LDNYQFVADVGVTIGKAAQAMRDISLVLLAGKCSDCRGKEERSQELDKTAKEPIKAALDILEKGHIEMETPVEALRSLVSKRLANNLQWLRSGRITGWRRFLTLMLAACITRRPL